MYQSLVRLRQQHRLGSSGTSLGLGEIVTLNSARGFLVVDRVLDGVMACMAGCGGPPEVPDPGKGAAAPVSKTKGSSASTTIRVSSTTFSSRSDTKLTSSASGCTILLVDTIAIIILLVLVETGGGLFCWYIKL